MFGILVFRFFGRGLLSFWQSRVGPIGDFGQPFGNLSGTSIDHFVGSVGKVDFILYLQPISFLRLLGMLKPTVYALDAALGKFYKGDEAQLQRLYFGAFWGFLFRLFW